jgi:outer membrane immunogenic protein
VGELVDIQKKRGVFSLCQRLPHPPSSRDGIRFRSASRVRFWVRSYGVAATFLMSLTAANAADLPSSAPPPVLPLPPAPYSWTGVYAGVNAGFGLDNFGFPFSASVPPNSVAGTNSIFSRGAVAGGQIGFNYQFTNVPVIGNAIVGLEASADWANLRGSTTFATELGTLSLNTRFENFGTLRARFGYAFDRLMIYFADGLTFGTVDNSFSLGAPSNLAGSSSFTHTGIFPNVGTVGIGVEYALTNNWTIRAEYQYDFIIAEQLIFNPAPGTSVDFNTRAMYHIVTLGLNYKFDLFAPPAPAPLPVVAKY